MEFGASSGPMVRVSGRVPGRACHTRYINYVASLNLPPGCICIFLDRSWIRCGSCLVQVLHSVLANIPFWDKRRVAFEVAHAHETPGPHSACLRRLLGSYTGCI
jgi:hypothetical protein